MTKNGRKGETAGNAKTLLNMRQIVRWNGPFRADL